MFAAKVCVRLFCEYGRRSLDLIMSQKRVHYTITQPSDNFSNSFSGRYDLSKNEITFGLPLSDVRGTKLSELCEVKIDIPCQPGKYRAYNGYCNNVQNPSWGASSRRYLRYRIFAHQASIL